MSGKKITNNQILRFAKPGNILRRSLDERQACREYVKSFVRQRIQMARRELITISKNVL
jgi:hypothetical protein